MKEDILGYYVETRPAELFIDELFSHLQSAKNRWLACLNPHSYAVAVGDNEFNAALRAADWLIPDGVGVVFASRFLGGAVKSRLTGWDIFSGMHSRMNNAGGFSVFFLGSSQNTLSEIRARMARDYPNVKVLGVYAPPFRPTFSPREVDDMIRTVNTVSPDVLWVAMTAPKQEKWLFENISKLDVRFAGAVGAVFDFYVGNVRRAHPVFQQLGLEWLPRLVRQPRRLWRRMFISAPVFVLHVVQERIRRLGR